MSRDNCIFHSIQFVILCQFHSNASPVLFTKLHWETIEWEKRRFFAYMAASAYQVIPKEVKSLIMIVIFLLLSSFIPSPFPSSVLAERLLYRYMILLWVVFCVMKSWVNVQKYESLLQFNTSWLASLRTWYILNLFWLQLF